MIYCVFMFFGFPDGTRKIMGSKDQGDITSLLKKVQVGQEQAKEEFFARVYDELRAFAKTLPKSDTMQPTAIVNELMVRLIDHDSLRNYENRRVFFRAAAEAMHRILIDYYRARKSQKRGGTWQRVPMDSILETFEDAAQSDFEQLYNALNILKNDSPRKYEVVNLRFFGGLSIQETATLISISPSTVERDWRFARTRLFTLLKGGQT